LVPACVRRGQRASTGYWQASILDKKRHGRRCMKKELWERIRAYNFENLVPPDLMDRISALFGGPDPWTHGFAAKIAHKRGWQMRFAVRAIHEYKRFVFLAVTSREPLTPPKVIDEVWHQHIQFTRAYREFCEHVLGRPFDHYPELAPFSEMTAQYVAQYRATLDLYQREFGAMPPSEIWGRPKFDLRLMRSVPFSKLARDGANAGGLDDTPLHLQSDVSSGSAIHDDVDAFHAGEGSFGGGGASQSWDGGGGHSGGDGGGDAGGCSGSSGADCGS
jgi:hypothetical protein